MINTTLFQVGLEVPIPTSFIDVMELERNLYISRLKTCYTCGSYDDLDFPNEDHPNILFCEACYKKSKHCKKCDYYHNEDDKCLEQMVECDVCNKTFLLKTRTVINNQDVCPGCVETMSCCNECDQWVVDEDMVGDLCSSCAGTKFTCSGCDCTVDKTEDTISDDDLQFCNEECYKKYYNKLRTKHNESYPFMVSPNSNALLMGVEWELELNHNVYSIMNTLKKHKLQIHEDASISERVDDCLEMELVTYPMLLEEHYPFWDKLFKSLYYYLGGSLNSEYEAGSHLCSVHVHVNRKAVSQLTLGKLLVFINDSDNSEFIDYVAERSETKDYCKRIPKKITDLESRDRYQALNIANRNTIEFRIFAGTNHKEILLSYIEFVASLIRWVQVTSMLQLNYQDYLSWAREHKKEYKFLWDKLQSFGGDFQ